MQPQFWPLAWKRGLLTRLQSTLMSKPSQRERHLERLDNHWFLSEFQIHFISPTFLLSALRASAIPGSHPCSAAFTTAIISARRSM